MEDDDTEFDITMKKNWMWHQHNIRLCNLYLIRFKKNGSVADKFGYQYIAKIEVFKKGYYKMYFTKGASENNIVAPWEIHSAHRDVEKQIKEMCRRAKWFLNYEIPVFFTDGHPELAFEYAPALKPSSIGSGIPKEFQRGGESGLGISEDHNFDAQLDALSGVLTDMKGIQLITQAELAAQDKMISSLMDKCKHTTQRLQTTNNDMRKV